MKEYILSSLLVLVSNFIPSDGKAFPGQLINYGQIFGHPQASGNVINYGQSFGPLPPNPIQEHHTPHNSFNAASNEAHVAEFSRSSIPLGRAPDKIYNIANINGNVAPVTIRQPQTVLNGKRTPITIQQPVLNSSQQANRHPYQVVRSNPSNLPQGIAPGKVINTISLNGNRAPITIEQPVIPVFPQPSQNENLTEIPVQRFASPTPITATPTGVVRSPVVPTWNQNHTLESPSLSTGKPNNVARPQTSFFPTPQQYQPQPHNLSHPQTLGIPNINNFNIVNYPVFNR